MIEASRASAMKQCHRGVVGVLETNVGSGSIKKDRFSFSRRMMPSLNWWKWFAMIGAILLD